MKEAVETTYQNLFDIKGRITRKQYWSTWVFNLLLLMVTALLGNTIYELAALAYFGITLITAIKRCHDVGYAGFYILIPIFNFIILVSNSDENENKWGPPLKHS